MEFSRPKVGVVRDRGSAGPAEEDAVAAEEAEEARGRHAGRTGRTGRTERIGRIGGIKEARPIERMRPRPLLLTLAAVLGGVAIASLSVVVIAIALWVISALAFAQTAIVGEPSASAGWRSWGIAGLLVVAAPLVLLLWKHAGDRPRALRTLTWLPLTWNLAGLGVASLLIPGLVGAALREHGAWFVAARVGDSHAWTRYLSALSHHAADRIDPRRVPPGAAVEAASQAEGIAATEDGIAEDGAEPAIVVPFAAEGNAILMEIELVGPGGSLRAPYLFDTGASFTTIRSETAARLGIAVPADAPTLRFNTASGPRESQMVHLPTLRLGEVTLDGLLVSVCDGCASERAEGLLGLNVIREFLVQMDYQAARMRLIPRRDPRPNRAYDIGPAVRLEVEGRPEIWLGRIRWVVEVHNLSTVAIEGVVPEILFSDGLRLRGAPIDRIPAGGVGRSRVEGMTRAADDGDLGFTLTLAEAYW